MPILISPFPPGPLSAGPGVSLHLSSDLVGPIPNDTQWQLSVYANTELGDNGKILEEHKSAVLPLLIDWTLQVPEQGKTSIQRPATPDTGVQVLVDLRSPSLGHQDTSDFTPATWTNQRLGVQAERLQQSVVGQGLNVEQSQQLLETWQSTFPAIAVDSTIPSTSGPSLPGGVISNNLPLPCFGLIVNVTTIDPAIASTTPDGVYFFPALAVATFFRGSDIWMRVPVHLPSKIIPLFTDAIVAAVATVTAATWILDMTYQVSFRDGCAGTVTEMRFP